MKDISPLLFRACHSQRARYNVQAVGTNNVLIANAQILDPELEEVTWAIVDEAEPAHVNACMSNRLTRISRQWAPPSTRCLKRNFKANDLHFGAQANHLRCIWRLLSLGRPVEKIGPLLQVACLRLFTVDRFSRCVSKRLHSGTYIACRCSLRRRLPSILNDRSKENAKNRKVMALASTAAGGYLCCITSRTDNFLQSHPIAHH